MTSIVAMAVSLFFVFNALGNVPLFVSLLAHYDEKKQRRIICRELLIALAVLLLFNFFGDFVMALLGISQTSLSVAGGAVLFIIAIGMIFPRPNDLHEIKRTEPLIVPLAIPIVTGPGAISTVMIYAEQLQNNWLSSTVIIAAWIPTFIICLLSTKLKHVLGQKGLTACQKLGGMLVCLIAVHMICTGFTAIIRTALH